VSRKNNDPPRRPPRVPRARPGPAGGKRDRNRRERVDQLCDAALPLFLQRGIAAVTIDDMVGAAGMAKGSFYRYVGDKEELVATLLAPLAAAFDQAMQTCEQALEAASPQVLPGIYLRLAAGIGAAVAAHPDLVRLYLQESRAPRQGAAAPVRQLADELTRRGVALSVAARDHGLLRADSDPRVGALTVIGAAERLLLAYLTGDDVGPIESVPAALVSVILDGVRAR
jgi:AcrR family transcriptional regulator